MARRLADNIASDHLTCPICKDTLTDPRLLPCDHTLCSECLIQLIRSSRRFNLFTCPVDRTEILAPRFNISAEEWARSFPKDELALRLIDTVSGNEVDTLTHESTVRCDFHQENYIEFYCFGCFKAICSECAVETHRNSDCVCKRISKCTDDVIEKLEQTSDNLHGLITYGQDIASTNSGNNFHLLRSKSSIRESVLKLTRIVQDFETATTSKLTRLLSDMDKISDVERIKHDTRLLISDLREKQKEILSTMQYGTTFDQLQLLSRIQGFLQHNTDKLYTLGEPEEPFELKLEVNQDFLTLCQNLVENQPGFLNVTPLESADFEDTEFTIQGHQIKFSSNVSPSTAPEFPISTVIEPENLFECRRNKPRFTDVVFCGHSIIAVDNENSRVQRFRVAVQYQFVDEIFLVGAYGLTSVHESDDVVVTVPKGRKRLVRLSSYHGLKIIDETDTASPYFNITKLTADMYAAICHVIPEAKSSKRVRFDWSCGVTSHIDILNIEGIVLKQIKESAICEPNGSSEPFIMPIKSLCGLPNGTIIVSVQTKTSGFITCIDENGRVQWKHSLNEKPEGVCSSEDSIFIFLSDLGILRVLSFDGHLKPKSTYKLARYFGDGNTIVFSKQSNDIAVVDKSDKITLFTVRL